MKKREEQLARELDAFLTARLRGRPLPPIDDEIAAEAQLASELIHLAATTKTGPVFLSLLEAQPAAAASREALRKRRPERTSLWLHFVTTIKEGLTMKRTLFAVGTLIALFVIAYFAWSALPGAAPIEPEAVAGAATATPQATSEPAVLPPLPLLGNASGLGSGQGGGGGSEGETPVIEDTRMTIWNPLAEAELILNAILPTEPAVAPVYEEPGTGLLTLEDAYRFAGLFGMSGPVYTEVYPAPAEGEVGAWTPPTVYRSFDGTRELSVGDTYLYYYDRAAVPVNEIEMMPFAQAGPLAESFLRDRGLLDFPYQMITQNGYDVEFRRLIDGRVVYYPEFQVSVNAAGQPWSVAYNPLSRLASLGDYPLRSAEEAWQLVLSEGFDYQRVTFNILMDPNAAPQQPVENLVDEELYRYWQRTFTDGESIILYPYPTVFRPVNAAIAGDATPRIMVEQFELVGTAEQLQALAAYAGKQVRISGTVRQYEFGQVIELVEWQPVEFQEYTFREGNIRHEGDQTLLVTDEGETILIPGAPAELADGERIYVSGWSIEQVEGATPVFNWQGLGRVVEVEEQPLPDVIDPVEVAPEFQIHQVSIDQVDLVYAFTPVYEEDGSNPRFLVQPAWRFRGTTDTNQVIEIYVQATADAYVEASAR